MIRPYWLSKPIQPEDRTMHDLLREDQIETMTQELDEAIEALDAQYGPIRVSRQNPVELLPAAQRAKLEQATGETAAQFWPRFKHAAHDDICTEGGFIHDQWQNFQDIAAIPAHRLTTSSCDVNGAVESSVLA